VPRRGCRHGEPAGRARDLAHDGTMTIGGLAAGAEAVLPEAQSRWRLLLELTASSRRAAGHYEVAADAVNEARLLQSAYGISRADGVAEVTGEVIDRPDPAVLVK
jgi:hypothetical protein